MNHYGNIVSLTFLQFTRVEAPDKSKQDWKVPQFREYSLPSPTLSSDENIPILLWTTSKIYNAYPKDISDDQSFQFS